MLLHTFFAAGGPGPPELSSGGGAFLHAQSMAAAEGMGDVNQSFSG